MNQIVANASETAPEQPFLSDEMAPPPMPELDVAIKEYVKTRDKRMELTKKESELNQNLLIMMQELSLTEYESNGLMCSVVTPGQKIAVKKIKGES